LSRNIPKPNGTQTSKKHRNKDPNLKPVKESEKKENDSAQFVSGHPESQGGSREGNIGHEHSPETGRGDRQV
jgi:hypothetical protein